MLLQEYSARCRDEVAALIGEDRDRYAIAFELLCSGIPPIPHRIAWVLEALNSIHPFHAEHYVPQLFAQIPMMQHQMELRAATRILAETPIQKPMIPAMWDMMLQFLLDSGTLPALKVNSMQLLYAITREEPELKYELRLVVQDQLQFAGPYLRSNASKMLKKLEKEIRKFEKQTK